MTDSSSARWPRWYEWLFLPVAVVVGLSAAIVLAMVGPLVMAWQALRVRRRWLRIYRRKIAAAPFWIRDLAWCGLVTVVAVAWWADHRAVVRRLEKSSHEVEEFHAELNHLEQLSATLQEQLASQREITHHSLTDDDLRRRLEARRRARHTAAVTTSTAGS